MVCNLPLCVAQILRRSKWFEDHDYVMTSIQWRTWHRKTIATIEGSVTTRIQHHGTTSIPLTEVISIGLAPETGSFRPDETYAESRSIKVHLDST